MRLFVLGVVVGLVGCGAPCSSSTSEQAGSSTTFSCRADDAGARVFGRPYSASQPTTADLCVGSVDGGALFFSVTVRSCDSLAANEQVLTECSLPALSPGRYVVGAGALIVPGDGGVTTCE